MNQKTDTEQMQDQQSQPIPQNLWENPQLFNQKLSDFQSNLMKDPLETLLDPKQPISLKGNPMAAMICIERGHPNAKSSELVDIANRLGLLPKEVFFLAAALGNASLLDYIESQATPEDRQAMVKNNFYQACTAAAENGNTAIVNHLFLQPDCFKYFSAVYLIGKPAFKENYIEPFINQKLNELKKLKQEFVEQNGSEAIFNLDSKDANVNYCVYIASSLIRFNEPKYIQDLKFLTQIPEVRKRVKLDKPANKDPELDKSMPEDTSGYGVLYQLAIDSNNTDAQTILRGKEVLTEAKKNQIRLLNLCDFDKNIKILSSKADNLSGRGYTELASKVNNLVIGLKDLKEQFLKDTDSEPPMSPEVFKNKCVDLMKEPLEQLKDHRGIYSPLRAFLNLIISAVNKITGSNYTFFKPDSVDKLDDFERDLDDMIKPD